MDFDLKFYPHSGEIKMFIHCCMRACDTRNRAEQGTAKRHERTNELRCLWYIRMINIAKREKQRIGNKIECRFMSFVTQRPHSFFFWLCDKASSQWLTTTSTNIFSAFPKIHLFCTSLAFAHNFCDEQMEYTDRPTFT